MKAIFPGFVKALPPPEVIKHRQVNEGERHQRAKVNQRRGGDQVEEQRRQRDDAHHDHVQRRSPPFWMDIAENALRENVIAAHDVQQARNAGV